jgi:hypothetical protein
MQTMPKEIRERQVKELIQIFCRAMIPPTPLERLETHLEAALEVARDESRTEAERLRELNTRLRLMPPV